MAHEWRLPHDHFVDDTGETIQIAASVQVRLTESLFRTDVRRRPSLTPHRGARARREGVGPNRPRDAEVGQVDVISLEQKILRLHVAMQYPVIMRVSQRCRRLAHDSDSLCKAESALPIEPATQ